MKKLILLLSCVCLLLTGTSCGTSSTSTTTSGEKNRTQLDVADCTKLPKPDEIVYIHKGKETVFQKGSEEFQEIFVLNQDRCTQKMDMLKLAMVESVLKGYDRLVYRYQEKYESVTFNLTLRDGDNPSDYWVSPQTTPTMTFYGFVSEPTELLAYLDSLE